MVEGSPLSLKAPFPWFGGKRRVAHLVWEAFGDVPNYVEPFAGSMAVLLARPHAPRVETVNDRDCYLANFWRAVQAVPEEVARFADWPVNEADLHARHRWLVDQVDFREKVRGNPEYFDARVAGWWVWGLSQWIGSGWCAQPSWEAQADEGAVKTLGIHTAEYSKRPMLDKPGRGVHQLKARGAATGEHAQRQDLSGHRGVTAPRLRNLAGAHTWKKRPSLSQRGGRGVGSTRLREQLPCISGDSGASGRGVHASGLQKTEGLYAWFRSLQERLRYVRVCCGDFARVLGPSVTEKIGITAVLLDPPYGAGADRDPSLYAEEDLDVAARARDWAVENGENPKLRIALCGYEGEHRMPKSWRCVAWKASGGYAASAGHHENSKRERIWFSPGCARVGRQQELFAVST